MKEPICIKSWNVCTSTCRHDLWSLSFNPVPIIKLYFRFLPSHNQSSHKPNLVKCNSPTNVGKNFIERLMADQLRLILILRYWEWYLGVAYFSQARGWNDDHVEICESPRSYLASCSEGFAADERKAWRLTSLHRLINRWTKKERYPIHTIRYYFGIFADI